MCEEYINTNMLENALKNSDKLKNKKNKILYEINKLDNEIENLKRKIDVCYNDKLDGNITLEMYKRTYNNFTLDIKNKEKEIKLYKEQLKNLENTNVTDDKYYAQKIEEFLKLEKPTRALITTLIDRIEIDEDKNIDIYYKFRLV